MQLNYVLPPGPREYWSQLEQEHKAAPEHQKWMYNPDPFVAMKEVQARQLAAANRREGSSSVNTREKDSLGGNLTGAIEIKMSSKLRDILEHAVKKSYALPSNPQTEGRVLLPESHENLRRSLSTLKFTPDQIIRTLTSLSSPSPLTHSLLDSSPNELEAAISHLLLSTPERDLPSRFLAQGAGDSFIQSIHAGSDVLKNRWITETLVNKAGFPSHIVKELIRARMGDSISLESLLSELIHLLTGNNSPHEIHEDFDVEERDTFRQSEITALESVYPDIQILDSVTGAPSSNIAGTTVVISIPNTPVILHFFLPANHPYPMTSTLPPMYLSDNGSGVPPYIRLHLLSKSLSSSSVQEREPGEGLALLIVNIFEEMWELLQKGGNLDIAIVMAPFLVYMKKVPNEDGESTSDSVPTLEMTQPNKGRASKPVKDTRTNKQILEQIDKTRMDQNVQLLFQDRQKLPAWSAKNSFLESFKKNRVVVCVGETGSGKTTQIPQYILDYYIDSARENRPEALPLNEVQIMITQPRRIAAISVAARVSAERGQDGSVSYSIRGESISTWRTKLLFCTTGVALRQLTAGDGLGKVNVMIIDEVHERSLDSDFLLLELRDLLIRNKNLKIVLMSATINYNVFLNYFQGAALITIPGRTYPVQDIYLEDIIPLVSYSKTTTNRSMQKQTEDELRAFRDLYKSRGMNNSDIRTLEILTRSGGIDYQLIATTVSFIASNRDPGAILIFLPGTLEITHCIAELRAALGASAIVLPLHANLSSDEQKKVFTRYTKRKIIVATNVAETSITIDDVVYVIDIGKAKEVSYDGDSRLSRLAERWISKAAARQRRGRAGRTQSGECYKLYTRMQEERFDDFPIPEILRTPLESLLLTAKATRETEDVKVFLNKAIDPPSITAMDSAWTVLQELGAIDISDDTITGLGRLLALLPVDLRLGKMLILGALFGCLEPMLTIAACLSSKPLFVSPMEEREEATRKRNKFMAMSSDLLTDVSAYDECMKVFTQGKDSGLRPYCENNFISFVSVKDITSLREDLREALLSAGLFVNSPASSAVSPALLQSIVMAGLYPGIARISLSSSSIKFDKLQSGTIQRAQEAREFKIFDLDNADTDDSRGQRVFLHPSSVMFNRNDWRQPFICYFRKTVTTKPYLRDATEVPLYAVLLFGGPLEVNQITGWLTIKRAQGGARFSMKAWPRIGVLINQLRQLLDARLKEVLGGGKLDAFGKGDPVFDAILALLTESESNFF